jgi:hypothetical protein
MEDDKLNMTLPRPLFVRCIDASNLSDQIDESEKLIEGKTYIAVTKINNILSDNEGFVLLDVNPLPFRGYGTYRFEVINNLSVN